LVYVTLGTDEHPFPRLLSLLESLGGKTDLVIQHGHTPVSGQLEAEWLRFVDYQTQGRLIESADAVISHAGVGSIMTVLAAGRRPIVVPRRREFGEHVDDHQLQIAREFGERGFVALCESSESLLAALTGGRGSTVTWTGGATGLRDAVARAVAGGRR
jgi:UDP-N-acetylglucosamine transferase subunit ALG13